MHLLRNQLHPARGLVVACGVWLCTGSYVIAEEKESTMRPVDPNWWRLSLEEIRAGDAIEQTTTAPAVPSVNLKEVERLNTAKQTGSGSLLNKQFRIEEVLRTPARGTPQRASESTAAETGSSTDTTLRDYTTATVNALAKTPPVSTNLFRALDPMRPIQGRDYGVFNRPSTPGEEGKNGKGSTETFVMPGSSTYDIPANPLAVVQSSAPGISLQPTIPTPNLDFAESTPEPPATEAAAKPAPKPGELPAVPPPITTAADKNQKPGSAAGSTTVKNLPPIPVQHGPPSVIPQRGGRNAQGFYEPKSTTDLQFER